jgi:hypothetical protein
MANELLIDFDDNGIIINSNEKCLINLNQSQENLKLTSTKEIVIEASESSNCTLNKDGISFKVGDDISIIMTKSGITLSAGKTSLELKSSAASLSAKQTDITGDSLLNLQSSKSVQIG